MRDTFKTEILGLASSFSGMYASDFEGVVAVMSTVCATICASVSVIRLIIRIIVKCRENKRGKIETILDELEDYVDESHD